MYLSTIWSYREEETLGFDVCSKDTERLSEPPD